MTWWAWVIVAAAVVIVPLIIGLVFSAGRGKAGGSASAGGIFGAFEEVFAPSRHEARQEQERQKTRRAGAPRGDGDGDGARRASTAETRTGPASGEAAHIAVDEESSLHPPPGWLGGRPPER